ncbi:MAG: exopolysaccharide biosynthesis protein [Gammaproteobacteria bacterium]
MPRHPNAARTGPPLSEILTQVARDETRSRVSVGDLALALQDRAIGALIFVFAFPNVIPLPPGASSVLGAPLLFLTAQLALGLRPWLPKLVADRSMDRAHFAVIVRRIAPWLARAERLLRPRLEALARPPFEHLIGAICLLLSVVLFLPIPMGNMPPAIAICLFALAILERDGIWVLAGLGATAVSIAVVWGVLFALFRSGLYLVTRLFS